MMNRTIILLIFSFFFKIYSQVPYIIIPSLSHIAITGQYGSSSFQPTSAYLKGYFTIQSCGASCYKVTDSSISFINNLVIPLGVVGISVNDLEAKTVTENFNVNSKNEFSTTLEIELVNGSFSIGILGHNSDATSVIGTETTINSDQIKDDPPTLTSSKLVFPLHNVNSYVDGEDQIDFTIIGQIIADTNPSPYTTISDPATSDYPQKTYPTIDYKRGDSSDSGGIPTIGIVILAALLVVVAGVGGYMFIQSRKSSSSDVEFKILEEEDAGLIMEDELN